MTWYTNAVFYELYVRAFADSNGDGHGDLAGLRRKLDYLQWLGVDCVWLLPINPSPLKDDGYDVASYYGIHPTYGLMEDFKLTIDEIHRRGMRVMMDFVVNHTSDQHPWFQEARRSKDSPLRDYYVWSPTDQKYQGVPIIFPGFETSNWEYDATTGEYYWHRFYKEQPDLNYDNPAVQQEMVNAAKFWLSMGLDGFRVDAVPYLVEREGTLCENLPETHEWIKSLRAMAKEVNPEAVLLAEACLQPDELIPYFGDNDEFQMCFHFPLMPRLYLALATSDRTSVVDVLDNTPELSAENQWGTFLRNHDELNLWLVSENERNFLWDHYAPLPEQRIFTGIRRRLAPLMNNDRRKIELMHSMLFTLPGSPVLYYGDEIGMTDNVALSDRNGVRTAMQWNDEANGGFSSASSEELYAPVNPDYKTVNVAALKADPESMLYRVREMIHARKELPVLGTGALTWFRELPVQVMGFTREKDGVKLTALHNLSENSVQVTLPEVAGWTDLFTKTTVQETGSIELPPYGYVWLNAN